MNIQTLTKKSDLLMKHSQKEREDHVTKYLKIYMNGLKFLEERYKIKPTSYRNWFFDQIEFSPQAKVLDYGCWGGHVWFDNIGRFPKTINCELIDQSLINIRIATQNLSSYDFNYSITLMSFYELDFDSNQFDIVLSDSGFSLMQEKTQFAAFHEAHRVLKKGGTFYSMMCNKDLTIQFNELLKGFDKNLNYNSIRPDNINNEQTLKKCLKPLYKNIEFKKHTVNYRIDNAKFIINLFMNLENIDNFVDHVVKKHRIKEFEQYLQGIIDNKGGIFVSNEYSLVICKK